MQSHYNVLFLCTGNSARSIMAEAIMNRKGAPHFTAYSAGSHPSGSVRPEAIKQLEAAHLLTKGLRSKSWDEFSWPDSPPLNFVFTVCDSGKARPCTRGRRTGSSHPPSLRESNPVAEVLPVRRICTQRLSKRECSVPSRSGTIAVKSSGFAISIWRIIRSPVGAGTICGTAWQAGWFQTMSI
jgi:protein-tyrosine-phosphatase